MKLEGTYTFNAPRNVVWNAPLDPEVLSNVLPGCEKLDQIGDNEYKGAIKIKIGPVQGKFQGKVNLLDIVEPDNYNMVVDGKGAPGFMKGKGAVKLEAQDDTTTIMQYSGEAQVGGRIASVGQRLLESSAKALTKQSLEGLNRQIEARLQAESTSDDDLEDGTTEAKKTPPLLPPVEAPSQTEFAMGIAKNLVEDVITPERRPMLITAGVGVIAILLFLNWWSNVIARKVANELSRRR